MCRFSGGLSPSADESIPVTHLIGALLFIFASVTDWVDGYYARKLNLVTNFGKFLDPLADKAFARVFRFDYSGALPSCSGLDGHCHYQPGICRNGTAARPCGNGEVVATNMLGKVKTWAQIIAISALLLHNLPFELVSFPFGSLALWVAVFFTVVSGWDYFAKNWDALKTSN